MMVMMMTMMMMTRFNWLQDKQSFVGSNLMPGQTDRRRQPHCHDDDDDDDADDANDNDNENLI